MCKGSSRFKSSKFKVERKRSRFKVERKRSRFKVEEKDVQGSRFKSSRLKS
jgi:hypothetical protein